MSTEWLFALALVALVIAMATGHHRDRLTAAQAKTDLNVVIGAALTFTSGNCASPPPNPTGLGDVLDDIGEEAGVEDPGLWQVHLERPAVDAGIVVTIRYLETGTREARELLQEPGAVLRTNHVAVPVLRSSSPAGKSSFQQLFDGANC